MPRIRSVLVVFVLAAASLLNASPTATAAPAPYGPAISLLTNCGTPMPPADATGNHSVGVLSTDLSPIPAPTIFPADSDVVSSTVAVSGQNLFLMWLMLRIQS